MSKLRKPKPLQTKDRVIYGGIDKDMIYIGAPYYMDYAQIHVQTDKVHLLRIWIDKVDDYLQQRKLK